MECQFPDAKSSGTEGSVRASENLIAAGRIASSPIIRDRAAREYVRDQGGLIFTARDLRGLASPAQLAPFVDQVRARWEANGQPPLYLSFDIDALDPAYAPGTGTPEPGGLSTAQAFTLLEDLSALPFVGMDCVEVAPVYDHQELTRRTAGVDVARGPRAVDAKLTHFSRRKRPSALQLSWAKECCESRPAMRC